MSSPVKNKRRDMDVMKLLMSDWKVELVNDCTNEFQVEFYGPKDSPYEGGTWKIRVELPDAYPYKSPSIGFMTRIYHPNVDEGAGSVCLDVINQTWSPMFDLINVFEVFLPQLLLYPNPTDPLNGEAAALMLREPQVYANKVKEYVRLYASGGVAPAATAESEERRGGPPGIACKPREAQDAFKLMDTDDAGPGRPAAAASAGGETDDDDDAMDGFLSSSDEEDDA